MIETCRQREFLRVRIMELNRTPGYIATGRPGPDRPQSERLRQRILVSRTGGMLSVAEKYIHTLDAEATLHSRSRLGVRDH